MLVNQVENVINLIKKHVFTSYRLTIMTNHIFISYLGGSAGDMFTASANGILLNDQSYDSLGHSQFAVQAIPFSIKDHEHNIISGKQTLSQVVDLIDWKYISTHLFTELPNSRINIVVSNTQVFNNIVLRQMQLQKLRMRKNSGTFYNIIKTLCDNSHYHKAANVWLGFAEKHAQEKMQQRLAAAGPKLDFSLLFKDTFITSISSQGWDVHLNVLKQNHSEWLAKQPNFSRDVTVTAIEQKLKSNNWIVSDEYI